MRSFSNDSTESGYSWHWHNFGRSIIPIQLDHSIWLSIARLWHLLYIRICCARCWNNCRLHTIDLCGLSNHSNHFLFFSINSQCKEFVRFLWAQQWSCQYKWVTYLNWDVKSFFKKLTHVVLFDKYSSTEIFSIEIDIRWNGSAWRKMESHHISPHGERDISMCMPTIPHLLIFYLFYHRFGTSGIWATITVVVGIHAVPRHQEVHWKH